MKIINPCLRCGGAAKIRYRKPFSWVECKKCRAAGIPVCDWQEEVDGKDRAIDLWNERMKILEELEEGNE